MKQSPPRFPDLAQQEVTTTSPQPQKEGITSERWPTLQEGEPADLQQLASARPATPECNGAAPKAAGITYDAVALLGCEGPSTEPLPDAVPGEIVLRVGAWSLQDLCRIETVARKHLLWVQCWYAEEPWSHARLAPGIYRLRMPVPNSNNKTFQEQEALLLPGEEVGTVALAVTALMVHLQETGKDLLRADFCRCAEALRDSRRLHLSVSYGRVYLLNHWDGNRNRCRDLWLAAARKC
ncbi:MAG: hypothetical protein L0Z62_12560 [Gemmataceae bacterium]|nr:hypothetical protein [Gemmataceae bacterium]